MKTGAKFGNRPWLQLKSLLAVVGFLLFGLLGRGTPTAYGQSLSLVWSDEFNSVTSSNVDTTKWVFESGNKSGWGNNEKEFYTGRTNNAYVAGGLLHIRAQVELTNGFRFTSARMKTEGKFWTTYGRIEWRAKLPAGVGMWPALWMMGTNIANLGWPGCGEIDVVENDGSDVFFVQGSIHSGTDATGIFNFTGGDSVTNFHVYDLDWTSNSITWSVDGTAYETQTSWGSSTTNAYPFPFNQPFFLLMNLATGGNYVGNPSTNTIAASLPQEMQVDYVRVYLVPPGNSWTDSNGKWETPGNWSLGSAPSSIDSADLITNAGNNTVTIDATTAGSFPSTMTIGNLYVAGTANSTNTLFLNNAGTNTPLQIINSVLTLDTSGALVVNNSAIVGTNGPILLIVGNTGGNAALTITNGGAVYSGNGSIGDNSESTGNSVLIAGRGSIWSNTTLYVGHFGAGNSLTVSNGGAVWNGGFNDLGDQSSSSNNTAVISDPGSVWSNSADLYIGNLGSGNSLTITNGGSAVTVGNGVVGWLPFNSDNEVTVSGNGANWQIVGTLYVAFPGTSNRLVIGTGGTVIASSAFIGLDFFSFASNNVLQVNGGSLFVTNSSGSGQLVVGESTGPASLILNNGTVTVNQLVLTDGANSVFTFNAGTLDSGETLVSTPQNFIVGDGIDPAVFHLSGGEHSFVNGALEIQNNASLTGCGDINGTLLVDAGGTVLADCGGALTFTGSVTNNGSIIATNGTTINFYGPVVNNGQISPTNNVHYYPIVPSIGATNSWISLTSDKWERGFNWSAGSPSIIQPALYITNASSKTVTLDIGTALAFTNTLTISNLTVSGPNGSTNTLWLNSMGASAPLQILSNLTVNAGGILAASNSALEVDNSGVIPGGVGLFIGVSSAGAHLSIHGGQVTDDDAYLGYNSSSSNNSVLVTGSGSVWSNGNALYVGNSGAANSLTITNGGTVYNDYGYIGFGPFASSNSSNTVLVTGSGSVWSSAYGLTVGFYGSGNSLTIASSGTVYDGYGDIGSGAFASSNTVLVTGSGSVWSNASGLVVGGYGGVGNSLTISNGAVVTGGGDDSIGLDSSANSNTVLVTGNGSVWDISGTLYIGWPGSSNQLIIGTGGTVIASNAVIGLDQYGFLLASNNVLQVNGGSLFVTNSSGSGQLVVGESTGPASLILNNGTVTVNQLVLTDGANSVFTFNAGTLASGGTFVTNNQLFVVGDGTDAATFQLNGGVHSFANNLEISNNATLSGCGTIEGNVTIDPGGTVIANCGGMLTFTGIVTNKGTMQAVNDSTLQAYGTVVNNGVINVINGSTQFLGGLVNNGCVLTEANVQISSITRSGNNITVQIPSGACGTYQLEVTPSLKPATWTNLGASQSGSGGVLTFSDTGGATNHPGRFYRIDITLP